MPKEQSICKNPSLHMIASGERSSSRAFPIAGALTQIRKLINRKDRKAGNLRKAGSHRKEDPVYLPKGLFFSVFSVFSAFSAVDEIPIPSCRHSVVGGFVGIRLPKQSSVEAPQMVGRIGVRELQRAREIGHGG